MKKKKWNYNLTIGLILTTIVVVTAVIGHFWTPYGPTDMNGVLKNAAPSLAHPFGNDNFGRDILSRIMNGMGTTCFVALCTVGIGVVFGTILGAITGFFGGWVDEILMRLNDALSAFPSILLALIFISLLGPCRNNIILALGILFIPSYARIVRSEIIRYKELEFVKSAQVMGAGKLRIIFVHILPNAMVSMLTSATVGFNNAVLAEASMSYLGLGVQPPEPSLVLMLSDAQAYLQIAPWSAIFPGIVIVIIILGFSMISEGLRVHQAR